MTVAGCGGSSKKSQVSSATTSSTIQETTTSAGGELTATTAPPVSSGVSPVVTPATTARATTAKKSSSTNATTPKGVTNVISGINNVAPTPTTAAPANIQPGGTITYAKTGDIASLDPVKITNQAPSDGVIADSLYDMLFYNDVATGTIAPQTAESITSTDAITWTLKLRPNIKFSDGTAYDASAVKFNYLRLQDPANVAVRATQANLIATMTVTDPQTLGFTLKAKNALFPGALTLIPFVASPAAVQAQGGRYGSDANNGGLDIMFNTKTKPFNDIRGRQAIGLAIDPKDYAKVVNGGLQEPIDSAFRHDSPFYDPTITQPFNDPVKAQQLIDQVAAANGGTFSFTLTAFPTRTNWCNQQFDKDVTDNEQTLSPQQRVADIKDAQRQFYSDVPTLYLERRYSWVFVSPNMQNFRYANDGLPLVGELWIKSHS
jgi:ABC-type transport system substrate-binding protein